MANGWCFLLLTLGVCGLSFSVPRQFHLVKEDKTWTEAQQYCREEFTDLATIDNMKEIDEIKRVMQNAGYGKGWRVWIGLKNRDSPKWQWSLADEGFYGENEAEFRNWDSGAGQPNNVGEDCVCVPNGGKWHDCYCTLSHHFICYNETNSTHPYVLVEDSKNWTEAQSYCREKHTDLASVRNQRENDKLAGLLTGGGFVWIGLFRNASWEWSDGSSSSFFRHWAPGEPSYDGLCVEMHYGLWNDLPCHTLFYFVCYEALSRVVVVSRLLPFYSGDNVTLRCDIPKYTGQHQYGWIKDSSPVPGETSQTITITLPEDAGRYQCYRRRGSSSVAPYISEPLGIDYHGVCGLSSVPRQFHVVKAATTWTAAQQYCREEFTDLVTIDNMAEMEEIKRMMQNAGVWDVWIGLKNGSSPKWQWSLADEGFYGENEAEFRNWDSGQPEDGAGEDCGCISQDGKLHDLYCTDALRFICYNGTNPTHPYVLVEDMKTWADAQSYCRKEHTDLASVRNQAENDKISNLLQDTDISGHWTRQLFLIGLFRDAREWSDGSTSSFRNWKTGEPNNDGLCVETYSSGVWHDVPCEKLYYSICYEALPRVVVVSGLHPFYSGDNVTLRCDIPKYTGQHQYVWIKDSSPVPGETSQTITITLPKDVGGYQCYRRRGSSSVAPYISEPLDIDYHALPNATVVVVSPQSPFNAGDDVTLRCDIPEYSDWQQYVWRKDNSLIPGKTSQAIIITLPQDAGQYQCSGERNNRPTTSTVSSSVDIISNDLPNATVVVVSPPPPFYSGDVVTLRCDIPEYSDWQQYVWLKDNSPVPGKTSETITITLPQDAGQYQCSGERNIRPMASTVSSSVDIISNDLPNATVEKVSPQSPFYAEDEVTLRCDISEYSDWHQYVWLKDNNPVSGKTSQAITISLPLEAGQYQCSGERGDRPMASTVSSSVDIISNALPNATVVVSPHPPFYSGDVVTLRCDISEYSDWHQYVWLKDNNPVSGKTSKAITITLPQDAGQYQCSGERNNRPTTSTVSSSVDIISNDLPNAKVEVVSPQSPFYSGDEVTLRCDISEYSDWHQYVWLKDNSPVPGKTSQAITITLPLEAGQYQCRGEREDRPMASTVSSSVDIISNDLPSATVEVVSPPLRFYSGHNVTLRCDIPEYSDWNRYVWLKNNSPIPGKTSQTIIITLPSRLPSPAGLYQCRGEREDRPNASFVSSSVNITVNAPSVVILSPPPPFNSGDVVTLRCDTQESTSGQHVQYVWFKDNKKLSGETSRTITVANPGGYVCRKKGEAYNSKPLEITFTPRLSQIVRVQLPPGVNVEDVEKVQEAFLQQIGDKLKANGLPSDAKLTWKKQPNGKVFKKKKRSEL